MFKSSFEWSFVDDVFLLLCHLQVAPSGFILITVMSRPWDELEQG